MTVVATERAERARTLICIRIPRKHTSGGLNMSIDSFGFDETVKTSLRNYVGSDHYEILVAIAAKTGWTGLI